MTKHFYRIGNQLTGLWYDKEGNFTGNIHTNEFDWLNASKLPMPFDNELVGFLSVADSLEHLYQWFSKEEILTLHNKGFYIEEWVANEYKFYVPYQHNVICQKTSILTNKLKIINHNYDKNENVNLEKIDNWLHEKKKGNLKKIPIHNIKNGWKHFF